MATSLILLKIAVLLSISRAQILQEMTRINVTKEDMDGIEDYTDLTIDQIIMQSLGGLEVAAMKMLTPGGNILAELDMVLTEKQYHDLYSPPEYGAMEMMPYFENKRKKRKAVRRNDLRWPNGVVPYTFARNHFSAKEVYGIKTAMREWEKYTCIKFREAESTDHNFVRFQNGPGCNSQLGMVGGQQILNLDANGCRWKGLYLHEIGHALGLVHEHQLPNRDDFITILYHNVAPSMRVWFQKYTDTEVNQYDVNYQLSSVMHYGTTAFSADGRSTTIRPKNNTNTDSIGKVWKKELAFTDVKAVNRMYECAAHCPSTMKCKNGGFVDQNCKCICPDGTDECVDDGGNGNVIPRRENDPCVNMYDDWPCNVWAKQGECEVNPRFMKVSCKKACRVCKSQQDKSKENHIATFAWQWLGMFADIFPSNWAMDVCEDSFKGDKCDDWAKNGDCVTNEEWMNENCKKACGLCNNADTTPNIDVTCTDIHSNIDECKKWARKGECQFNKNWMSKNCKKTCKVCEGTVSDEPKKRPRQRYDRNDQDPIDRDTNDGSCADIHNTKECQEWAKRRECFRNPKWMIPNCRKSCRKCQDGTCKNLYDDTKCRRWAQNRECIKNPTWMGDNCALSCNTCQTEDDSTRVGRRGNDDSNTNNNAKDVPKDDPTTNDGSGCRNDHNDKECNVWAKYGHCDINPSYMHKSCKLACGKCAGIREDSNVGTRNRNDRQNDRSRDETRINTTTKPTTTTGEVTSTTCRDINPSCPSWAKQGICASNPGYALINCRKTCGVCDKPCVDRHTFCVIWANENHCETNAGYMLWFCSKSCKNC